MLNQLRSAGLEVTYPQQGDFLVDGRYLFEVGGAGKGFSQIKAEQDTEMARPDWLQGKIMLYFTSNLLNKWRKFER